MTRGGRIVNNRYVLKIEEKLPGRFGPFYLYDLIGQGGMAQIFLAKTFTGLGTQRRAVIKRILPHLTGDRSFGEMLINEAKLCARLSHANIVQTYDLGQIQDRYYIAMEYVEGFDLNRLLGLLAKARLALPLPFALYIIVETLRGLDYAHRLSDLEGHPLGIIHRDVSPTNVLISTEGEVKLCDFGIAKVTLGDLSSDRIQGSQLEGKVAYMSPEQLDGGAVDLRSDLYAAGILLWELLSGRRLFKTKDEEETLARAKAADVPPLTDVGFPLFEQLAGIVSKALSKNLEDRYQTGQEFIEALEDYMHGSALFVSQLKFADFLMDNFGADLLEQRRERERGLAQLGEFRMECKAASSGDRSEITDEILEDLDATFIQSDSSDEAGFTPGEDDFEPSKSPKPTSKDAKTSSAAWILGAVAIVLGAAAAAAFAWGLF